jgi:hypothetical protein
MENKVINATDLGPEIILEPTGKIKISGKSRMEDAASYYKEVHEWLSRFLQQPDTAVTVEMNLSYFNSSSAKQLLKLLMSIDKACSNGKVIWIYPASNDTLLERGQELEIMLDLTFEYVAK